MPFSRWLCTFCLAILMGFLASAMRTLTLFLESVPGLHVDEFGFFLLVQHSTLRENRVITHLAEELLWYF